MHELVLHSYRRCPFAIRVRMVLEEKNLLFTTVEEDLSSPSAELLRLHPEGRVPLLIHNGLAIHESSIITEYLDESFGSTRFIPKTSEGRASMRMWTYWCNELLKPDLDSYKYEWNELSTQAQAELVDRMRSHLRKLDSVLASQAFLMGDDLSLADIHVFPFYRQLQKSRPDFQSVFETTQIDPWLDRIVQRPSFVRVMAKK